MGLTGLAAILRENSSLSAPDCNLRAALYPHEHSLITINIKINKKI